MADLRPSEADTLDRIEYIRAKNNRCWMSIMRIALASDPKTTRAILRDINLNDQHISTLLGKLSDE